MPEGIHILKFQNTLQLNKEFLKSLVSNSLFKQKLVLQKATNKELHLLQKILTLFLRGEIAVTQRVINRLNKSKKLSFIEATFAKIKKDPNLRKNILKLAPIIQLFAKATLKKK